MPFNYNITIDEPSTVTRTQDTYVYQALNDALSAWSVFLNGNGVLNVHVSISGLGGSSSTAGTFIAQAGPTAITPTTPAPNAVAPTVVETSGAYALRTGQHLASSDIEIVFNSAFLPVKDVRQSIDLGSRDKVSKSLISLSFFQSAVRHHCGSGQGGTLVAQGYLG